MLCSPTSSFSCATLAEAGIVTVNWCETVFTFRVSMCSGGSILTMRGTAQGRGSKLRPSAQFASFARARATRAEVVWRSAHGETQQNLRL